MTVQRLPSPTSAVAVVGRFPPPLDGQAIATARLADLLADVQGVRRIDVGAPEGDRLGSSRGRLSRTLHFARRRRAVRSALGHVPGAPVLWTSISPTPLGHARDRLTVAPAFGERPVVAVVHRGDFVRLFTSPWTRPSGLRLTRRLARVVFLTESLSEQCAPWLHASMRAVIPNTIDDAAVPSAEAVEAARAARVGRLKAGRVRLLYLSGMIPTKGYGDVLEALAVLRRRGTEAEAVFAGRWPSSEAEAHFRQRITDLRLTEAARVLGPVSDRNAVRRLYLDADAFVLPTVYPVEAQPLTVIEAFASGTPAVVTRHAGLPEMVTAGSDGTFVPPHTPEAIAGAVLQITSPDAWPGYSCAARATFESRYSPEAIRARWLHLLADL